MDVLDWIERLQGLGWGGLCLLFLYITNKYHLNEKTKQEDRHRDELKEIRKEHNDRCDELNTAIDAKNDVIGSLSIDLRGASTQALSDMERHLNRQGEREVARERDNAQTAASMSQLATAIDGLTQEVRASRG
jgi:hypothetical protein